jgi:hypothetical protein
MTVENVTEYDEEAEYEDDEDEGWGPIPNTVLLPVFVFIAFGAVALLLGTLRAFTSIGSQSLPWPAVVVIGAGLIATGVGLVRHSRVAHTVAYVVGGLTALSIVGLIPGVALVISLSVRSAKDWFNIR